MSSGNRRPPEPGPEDPEAPDTVGPLPRRPSEEEDRSFVEARQAHQQALESQKAALREAQRKADVAAGHYRELYDSAPVAYLETTPQGAIVRANRAAAELLGEEVGALHDRAFSDFILPSDRDAWLLRCRALGSEGAGGIPRLRLRRMDSQTRTVELRAEARPDPDDRSLRLHLALLDITAREEARQLREIAEERELRAEQAERRRIAEELHDDVGQTFSLASMRLAALEDVDDADVRRQIHEIRTLLEESRRKISSLSFQLSPPLLYEVGFVAAAHWLAEEMQRLYGLNVDLSAPDDGSGSLDDMDDAARTIGFRALREFLVNVARHSGTVEAHVSLRRRGDALHMDVRDHGFGFDPGAIQPGFGMASVAERLRRVGGSLEIKSREGKGTTVSIAVPIRLARNV